MVIRIWHYIVLSCIVILYIDAKPFSLNEAIAAEERQKQAQLTISRPKIPTETSERFSLNKAPRSNTVKTKKFKATENLVAPGGKITPLKYRKAFQIRSPLKPKKLKYIQKVRNKRRNKKRQINDEKLKRKYVPLLRSLSMLFDDILSKDTSDSYEVKRSKYKRAGTAKDGNASCTCNNKSDTETRKSKSSEEAIVSTTPLVEVTPTSETIKFTTIEATTTETYHTTASDISGFRQDTVIPLLPARNTNGSWRDYNGLSEGGGPTFHASFEGDIAGDHRNSKHYPGSGEHKPSTKNDEENPYSPSRDYADSDGYRGRIRGDRNDTQNPVYRRRTDETNLFTQNKNTLKHFRRDFNELTGENNFKVGRNEAKSAEFLQESTRGDRRFVPEIDVSNEPESLQSKENYEESNISVAHDIAGNQRFPNRDGTPSKETKKTSSTNATLISVNDLGNPVVMLQKNSKHKAPFVTIIDGYSVARDKNGANKLAEQSIRFHS